MDILRKILKVLASGLAAFAILCCLMCGYCLSPMFTESRFGNTDFVWPAHAPWFQMVEGISWGQFDDWGFNNPQVIENPDILVLGSSHMEATYIMQEELLSSQLQQLLGGEATVYNMGISGNNLMKSLQYLPRTLEIFEDGPDLILIEANAFGMTQEDVSRILNGEIPSIYAPKPDWQKPILGLPALRLLAKQKNLGLFKLLNPPRKPAPAVDYELPGEPLPADSPEGEVYDPLFSYLKDLQDSSGTQILIFYQPTEELQKDGTVFFPQDPMVRVFEKKCRDSGIGFLDLTGKFQDLYSREHLLPHGFITGRIGTGHLNAHGHRAIAEAVNQWIQERKGEI